MKQLSFALIGLVILLGSIGAAQAEVPEGIERGNALPVDFVELEGLAQQDSYPEDEAEQSARDIRLEGKLNRNLKEQLSAGSFEIKVRNGTVILDGVVDSELEKRSLEQSALQIADSSSIENRLRVSSK